MANEICTKMLKKLSEELRAKFPATTCGYFTVYFDFQVVSIRSETNEIHSIYLSEVFLCIAEKKPKNLDTFYIYSIAHVTSAAFIAPIPKIFVTN